MSGMVNKSKMPVTLWKTRTGDATDFRIFSGAYSRKFRIYSVAHAWINFSYFNDSRVMYVEKNLEDVSSGKNIPNLSYLKIIWAR